MCWKTIGRTEIVIEEVVGAGDITDGDSVTVDCLEMEDLVCSEVNNFTLKVNTEEGITTSR